MKTYISTFLILAASTSALAASEVMVMVSHESAPQSFSFLEQNPAPEKVNAAEDAAYSQARQALDENSYSKAAAGFDQVAKMNGRRADAATYWKAYSQNKQGQRNEALGTIAELR